jgi:hypothetical protein
LVPANTHLQLPNSSDKSRLAVLHQCTYTWFDQLNMKYWRKPSHVLLPQSDLVPSNSQIQLPKFQLRVVTLHKQTHHTHVLNFAMVTDRGAGDKMLEKTELLKLSVEGLKTTRQSSVSYNSYLQSYLMKCLG